MNGGGGGGAVSLIVLVVAAFMFIWMWRKQQNEQPSQQQAPWIIQSPGSPAAPAAPTGNTGTLPPTTTTPPATVPPIIVEEEGDDLPDPNPSLCSSLYNGRCNTECGANGDIDECEECNATCDTDVPYTGPDIQVPPPAGAGGATATCPPGYTYDAAYNVCRQNSSSTVPAPAPATPTCPSGYVYDATYNVCRQSTAQAAPAAPIASCPSGYIYNPTFNVCQQSSPTTTTGGGANPTVCKNTYNGSCNTECSSQSQSVCNACMIACGTATAGGATSGGTGVRTPECKSKYNGSCNTECSSGSTSVCNACRVACGLSANIAKVYTAKDARHLLNNRLYNSLRARKYSPRREVAIGYTASRRGHIKIGNF